MIERIVGVVSSFMQGAVQEKVGELVRDKLDERALERLYGALDAAIERRCADGAEAEAVRDAADKLTYEYTGARILPDGWRAELTDRFYREHPDIPRSDRLDDLFTDCYVWLDKYLSEQLSQEARLSLLVTRQDGRHNTDSLRERIDQAEGNLKELLQSGRGIPMLCVCRERPVRCEVWDSEYDDVDLFSGDTVFCSGKVGENTRKLTLTLKNPGQLPITRLALSDFMIGIVTDVQYGNSYYESAQIFQYKGERSVRNLIFPGESFDLSIVFDDELAYGLENQDYLYVSFAASALCVEGEEPARYHYDLFCDRRDAPADGEPSYAGTYGIRVLRQS
ncbi:hypothetical protein [uncultured Anaerotruncus sp.]|uniref:hypothetical protein n=1 Tax=uncultured Anaerotruncus sp. TaxID=905011 RepID=UPI00280C09AA|nr:hypothetical protein [uncultured Anaerotruncus sp.]